MQSRSHQNPFNAPNVIRDFAESFSSDRYELDTSMLEKYERSRGWVMQPGTRISGHVLAHNGSIFDVSGNKVTWGSITPEGIRHLEGVYYVLSEFDSTGDRVPARAILGFDKRSVPPYLDGAKRPWISDFEETRLAIQYIRDIAIARIVDGQYQVCADDWERTQKVKTAWEER